MATAAPEDTLRMIADFVWSMRREGAKTFFPNVPLPKARTLILVGATLGRAQLRGRPLTLSALCRQIEMPYATAERRVRDLIEAGWVRRLDHHFFLNLERLQEPTYASYFEYVKAQVTVTHKKLSKMEKPTLPRSKVSHI
jgi:IclR helix-turn-helix domain